jgi:Ribonuclease HI
MIVFCDSSAHEACVVLPNDDVHLFTYPERVTTNQGEYLALLHALDLVKDVWADHIYIRSDSQLIVNQVSGIWRCRDPKLVPLRDKARTMLGTTGWTDYMTLSWTPREQNLAGIVLEGRKNVKH